MKAITTVLMLILAGLQYKIWFADGNVFSVIALKSQLEQQHDKNIATQERNRSLAAEVVELKQGQHALEERARADLGMIKPGEQFYQIVEYSKA